MKKRELEFNKFDSLERTFLIDSGAFSAWNLGFPLSVEEYTEWCLEHLDRVDYFVNMDIIPGGFGRTPTYIELEESAEKGWKNYIYMAKKGIPRERLIHVFHQGESWKWLKRMAYLPYIGLSPANDKGQAQKTNWFHKCMEHVTDSNGFPVNRWHGFAVTSYSALLKFPFFSADSTAWSMTAAYGKIILNEGDKYQLYKITNTRSHSAVIKSNTVMGSKLEEIKIKAESRGISWEQLSGLSPVFRAKFNVLEMNEFVETRIPAWPWPYKAPRGYLF